VKAKIPAHDLEFSRPISVEKIPPHGLTQNVEAKEAERQKLAERFGLLDLGSLKAELTLHPAGADQSIMVTGKIAADVTQQCVVTLDPLPAHIESTLEVFYMPQAIDVGGAGPSDPDEQEMEVITDGAIDLGELAAQHLGIALDPYPRKPGVGFVEAEYGDTQKPAGPLAGPLAELAKLAKKPKDSN
jgi:uncharacterized metal-binding protein YceD (DUF177 family)